MNLNTKNIRIVSIIMSLLISLYVINKNLLNNPFLLSTKESIESRITSVIEFVSNKYNSQETENQDTISNKYNSQEIEKSNIIIKTQNEIKEKIYQENNWKLEIPKINLKFNITEDTNFSSISDTTNENYYLFHLKNTDIYYGKIILYIQKKINLKEFDNLKLLNYGEILYYEINNIKKKYFIISNYLVNNSNEEIQKSSNNTLILLANVSDIENVKRCIRAILLE